MEPILGSSVCLICFETTGKQIFVPSDAPEKLFMNCNKYLHSTLTKGTLKEIKLPNETQVPLCKSCFDSALELTQLSEQLTTIQKDISDLTVSFSMAVFHRRSQVYSIGQSCKTSLIVEFNEACLPPNLFSMKLGDPNIPNKNNQDMDIDGLHLQTVQTDISNVKCDTSYIQFDNLARNPQQSVENDEIAIQFNKKESLDKQCGQSTVEQNQNLSSVSEMSIAHVSSINDSKKCTYPNKGVKITMSDLLKSVKMPKIILERINILGHKLDVSVGNAYQTKFESRQNHLDETLFKDDEFSVHSLTPGGAGDGMLLKCFYCEKTFAQECHRTLHHQTHTVEKTTTGKQNKRHQKFLHQRNQRIYQITPTGKKRFYKCSYCEKVFSFTTGLQIHERIHTGEKPFKCSFCSTRFYLKHHMKLHERTHTGEKPYKCSVCSTRFRQLYSLKRHERTHSEEKPFKCSFCNTGFKNSDALKVHERTHTGEKPLKCSFCSTRFNHHHSLKCHERIHTGERPFQCSFCDKRFTQSSDLKRHESTHTGEKPFKNSHRNYRIKQVSTLINQSVNQKDGSLGDLEHQEQMHSKVSMEFKCLFCEMTFRHDEERANHEKIHRREDEIVNENLIVGI